MSFKSYAINNDKKRMSFWNRDVFYKWNVVLDLRQNDNISIQPKLTKLHTCHELFDES